LERLKMLRSRQISVRLLDEEYELVARAAKDRGEHKSSFIRRAIRKELTSLSLLPPSMRRALGMAAGESDTSTRVG
jgi:hypothetical protein